MPTPPPQERLQIVLNQRSIHRRRVLHILRPLNPDDLLALNDLLPPLCGDRLQELRPVAIAVALAVGYQRAGLPLPERLDPYLRRDLDLFEDPDLHLTAAAFAALPPERAEPLLRDALQALRPRALHVAPAACIPALNAPLLDALAAFDDDRPHMPTFACSLAAGLPQLRDDLHLRLRRDDLTPFAAATLLDALALRPDPSDLPLAIHALQRDLPRVRDAAARLLLALRPDPAPELPDTPAAAFAHRLLTLPQDQPLADAFTALAFQETAGVIDEALNARAADLQADLPPWLPPAVLIAHATVWFLRGVDATHRFTWQAAVQPLLAASQDAAHALVAALLRYPATPDQARSIAWALRTAGPDALHALAPLLEAHHRDDRDIFFELAAAHPERIPLHIFQEGLQDPQRHIRSLCRNALRWRSPDP